MQTLYSKLAHAVSTDGGLVKTKADWIAEAEEIVSDHLPSGSGFNAGTRLLIEESHGEKLTFQADFHHLNAGGYYDGWTQHKVIVTPSLRFGFDIRVTGRDKNAIKEYIAETFYHALRQMI